MLNQKVKVMETIMVFLSIIAVYAIIISFFIILNIKKFIRENYGSFGFWALIAFNVITFVLNVIALVSSVNNYNQ